MFKYFAPAILLFLIGCKSSDKDVLTYFGGKIINPKDKHVILYNHEGVIDSIKLKEDDTFSGELKNIKEGLYYFYHGQEFQYVFLEPSDSLLIRLNTWDFDESIVFSGKNADRNNALIETFLQNEKDEKEFSKYYDFNFINFKRKIDSLLKIKQYFLDRYSSENQEDSQKFINTLDLAMKYPVYRKYESYYINNVKNKEPKTINSKEILSYRANIKTSMDSLMFYSPYNNLKVGQIYSDTYMQGHKKDSKEFTVALLKNINKNIQNNKVKNGILRRVVVINFYRKSDCSIDEEIFKTFFTLSTEEKHKKEINNLLSDIKKIKKSDTIPEFNLISPKGEIKNIKELIENKNALLYFRNPERSSDEWVASRFNYLAKKNPKVSFFVINTEEDNKNYIKGLDIKNQYYLNKKSSAHNFLTSKLSRSLLVNKKGIIKNGFASLSSNKIVEQLSNLQKE